MGEKSENNAKGFWGDESHVERLKAMWAEGNSCSQIARALGCGITRNAVIGKVSRLGLNGRVTTSRITHSVQKNRAPAKPRLAVVKSDEPAPPFLCAPETFPDGPGCRYTPDDVSQPGWVMCGRAPFKPGRPWCEYHAFTSQKSVFDTTRTEASQKAAATKDYAEKMAGHG